MNFSSVFVASVAMCFIAVVVGTLIDILWTDLQKRYRAAKYPDGERLLWTELLMFGIFQYIFISIILWIFIRTFTFVASEDFATPRIVFISITMLLQLNAITDLIAVRRQIGGVREDINIDSRIKE
jgi:hypothetical protein